MYLLGVFFIIAYMQYISVVPYKVVLTFYVPLIADLPRLVVPLLIFMGCKHLIPGEQR